MFILCSRTYYFYLTQYRNHSGHKLFCTILDPSFSSICYDICFSICYTHFQYLFGAFFQNFHMFHYCWQNFLFWIKCTSWIDETGTKNCIIPIKNDYCFIKFGFVRWHQPNFLLCKICHESSSHLVCASFILHKIKISL